MSQNLKLAIAKVYFYTGFVQDTGGLIRATLYVGLICQTIVTRQVSPDKESDLTRDDIACKLVYAANGMAYLFLNNSS